MNNTELKEKGYMTTTEARMETYREKALAYRALRLALERLLESGEVQADQVLEAGRLLVQLKKIY